MRSAALAAFALLAGCDDVFGKTANVTARLHRDPGEVIEIAFTASMGTLEPVVSPVTLDAAGDAIVSTVYHAPTIDSGTTVTFRITAAGEVATHDVPLLATRSFGSDESGDAIAPVAADVAYGTKVRITNAGTAMQLGVWVGTGARSRSSRSTPT